MDFSIESIGGEFAEFNKKTMVNIHSQTEHIEKILQCPPKTFIGMPLNKIEEALLSLSQYSLFLLLHTCHQNQNY